MRRRLSKEPLHGRRRLTLTRKRYLLIGILGWSCFRGWTKGSFGKGVFWKGGLFGKGSFKNVHFLEAPENSEILETRQSVESKRESGHLLATLENLEILEIPLDEKTPFRSDPPFQSRFFLPYLETCPEWQKVELTALVVLIQVPP